MKNKQLLEAIDKFAVMAEIPLTKVSPGSQPLQVSNNEQFKLQRERLDKFYDQFSSSLRRIRNQMGNEIGTLKMRDFDLKMRALFAKLYNDIVEISKEITPEKPYIAAEKLVHRVLDRQHAMFIENLDFLAKHHLNQTKVDFKAGPAIGHPEILSLEELKRLAESLRDFMARYPLIKPFSRSAPPPGFGEVMKDVPDFRVGQDDKTRG